MKSRKLLCLLLALAMLVCVFAGCAKTESNTQTDTESSTANTESTASTEAAETPAAMASTSTSEALAQVSEQMTEGMTSAEMAEIAGSADSSSTHAAALQVQAGDYTSAGGIHYPLTDDESGHITFWFPFGFGWEAYMDSWNDMTILPYLKQATGVELEFDCVSQSAATEQFQLYIAGGDYSDIMQPGDYYTGGLGQAYEDEVIIDLTDLLPVNSPDYWSHLSALDDDTIAGVKTDNKMLGYVVIYNANWSDQGLLCIRNMAEECGYEVVDDVLQVSTIDTFTQLLKDVKDTFGCEWTYSLDSDDGGSANLGNNAFGAVANISSTSTSVGVSLMGDTVVAAATQDSFRDYAEWFYDLYTYGVFNPEFYITTLDQSSLMAKLGSGDMFVWTGRADGTDTFKDYVDADHSDWDSAIVAPLYAYEGQANEYPTTISLVDNKQFVVTTSCEQVDLVMNYLNFGFTEGGYELYNWGVEGDSFYIDDEGTYHYTDIVWNNPEGIGFMMASSMQIMGQLPRYDEHAKLNDGYTVKQVNAQNAWTDVDGEDLHTLPTKANLTTEESNSIINEVNDVIATISEWGLKFFTGSLEINDENWADFQSALQNSGIEKVVETYQNAYDSYLRGERDNLEVASTGGPGGDPGAGGPPPA